MDNRKTLTTTRIAIIANTATITIKWQTPSGRPPHPARLTMGARGVNYGNHVFTYEKPIMETRAGRYGS
eukprot:4554436-Pyramimonas_sp.AAC.1